ncbi:hypothetical protein M23134_00809 [Microscilla marina ATCC 23134]|uniref:Uncharacterized protein n=1 Tax=Microscilla marina ATCC 23134 TaxID=313606 RepID=A1ZVX3_MICM2|nr:hypothetical protein M23134_00809 [Microscilla marina ATCC 23134]
MKRSRKTEAAALLRRALRKLNRSLFERSEFELFRRSVTDLGKTNYSCGVFGYFFTYRKK